MKRMSFFYTTQQVRDGVKDVTRRLKCRVKAGDRVLAVVKMQGLKKGQKQEAIREIEIVSVRKEDLWDIGLADEFDGAEIWIRNQEVEREGFADMTSEGFIDMFCSHMKCTHDQLVYRIEFKYV